MRVALYVSSWVGEAAPGPKSLRAQLELCEAHAAAQGWRLVGPPYADAGIPRDAPLPEALGRVLEDAAAGRFDLVLVHDLSGLAPDARRALARVRQLAETGAALATVAEGLDTTGPDGRQALQALLSLARLAETERETSASHAASGRALAERSGRLPYGYARGERLAVDPARAGIVRAIFARRAAGDSLTAIADRLTEQGVPTARGGRRWYASTIRGILAQEEIYRGGLGEAAGQWPAILEAPEGGAAASTSERPVTRVSDTPLADGQTELPEHEPQAISSRDWAVWN